ncbi:MAG: cadherin-like beta sandwich domain-containing protein, partial [Bacteroidales bacterium]|nr:cadherin-like beta sandwich domain-containing protein [Bacteroidales bacterium]
AASEGYTVAGDTGTKSLVVVGANEFKITVTKDGGDGTNTREYTVTVTREEAVIPELPAKLSSLSVSHSGGTLSLTPLFNPDSCSYSASVENAVSSVTIAAAAADGYNIIGDTGTKSLNEGANIFTINVTKDGDGTNTCEYTVTITRKGISTETSGIKTDRQNVNVFANNNEIHVVSGSKIFRIRIYNILGALLYKVENINADTFDLISTNLPKILIVEVLTERGHYNVKIINK